MSAQVVSRKFSSTEESLSVQSSPMSISVAAWSGGRDNPLYATEIATNKNIGYTVKTNTNYTGDLEVLFNGKVSKWLPAMDGRVTVSPEIMKGVGPGIYPMKLRPMAGFHTSNQVINTNWSNQAIVLVNNLSGKTPGFTVEVSTDGVEYANKITTTLDKGYYLRVIPVYEGTLEAMVIGGHSVKWLNTDKNGVAVATPEIMKKGTSTFSPTKSNTTYSAVFRPYNDGKSNNMYPQSNVVTVFVK